MAIEVRGCEKCSRPFVAEVDGNENQCAPCGAADYGRDKGLDLPGRRHLAKARLQELADIKVALRELVDVLDKWRP